MSDFHEPMKQIQVVDSHTGGEPTRIIVSGGPDLGEGPFVGRLDRFRDDFDTLRSAVTNEPRGSDVLVGGLLCEPTDATCTAGIIFFNNTGYLGMCGHGTIGLMVTLQHLGRADLGKHRIETPVGVVTAELFDGGEVAIENVPSYRLKADVEVEVPGVGTVVGDIAWGGNWFFLVKNLNESLTRENVGHLTRVTLQIRDHLVSQGITGTGGATLDHIEIFGDPHDSANNSRNFVLCPGGAYDRSPCGTGMSAKLACLAAAGQLAPGEEWRQESIIGSVFACTYRAGEQVESDELAELSDGSIPTIVPTVRGQAFVCGESTLILNPADPFCMGIR